MSVITSGRKDIAELFKLSGIIEYKKLNHTPFLAFIENGDNVEVKIIDNSKHLLELPDNTKVMAQWRGDWHSDFFQFCVGDVRQYVLEQRNHGLQTGS